MAGIDRDNQFPNSVMARAARFGLSRFVSTEDAPVSSGTVTVVPSDTQTYDPPLRSIYVGGTGNLAVKTPQGVTVTYRAVPVGTTLQTDASAVLATGTTATLLVGSP